MAEEKKEEAKKEVPKDKPLAAVEAEAKKEGGDDTKNETKPATDDKTHSEEKTGEETKTTSNEAGKAGEDNTDKPAEITAAPEDGTDKADSSPSSTQEIPKKKRFGFKLPFGKKKAETGDAAKSETVGTTEEKISSEASSEIAAIVKEFEISSKVEKEINENTDLWVFRIKKSAVLIVLGLLIVIMWLIPASRGIKMYLDQKGVTISWPLTKTDQTKEASASGQTIPSGPKIRIRDGSNTAGTAEKLAEKLKTAGFNQVEIQIDADNEYEGVTLIVKPTGQQLRNQINQALGSEYMIASPSAELTSDSDFEAVILLGKVSLKKTGVKGEATSSAEMENASGSATAR